MSTNQRPGKLHPLSQVIRDCIAIFHDLGFSVATGPEIETEHNNFDSLEIPANHPARGMHDTFWIKDKPGYLMRTHISAHQVPYLKENKNLLKQQSLAMISPGRVFRNEATDATHEAQFHYLEGLMVGKDIHLGHLKGVLEHMIHKILGNDVDLRFRPGNFPFVEPGVEVDLKFKGKWMEVLGAGVIHPNVLRNAEIDPDQYSGFAFGVGIDRIAMMKYGFTDVRMFYTGDLRVHFGLK